MLISTGLVYWRAEIRVRSTRGHSYREKAIGLELVPLLISAPHITQTLLKPMRDLYCIDHYVRFVIYISNVNWLDPVRLCTYSASMVACIMM